MSRSGRWQRGRAGQIDDGLVTRLYIVRNPEKLSRVRQETTVSR
ncbi:hypothetical protein [Nonomuraea sp. GTA35]